MRHVKEIRLIIDQGQYRDAHEALDNLLSLGPSNIEALKLKSILYAQEGRFAEEARLWEKIISQDHEDHDALYYFQRRHLEDREVYYFTDQLPGGGRRFLAHPRAIINASLTGLLGCLLFLLLSNYAKHISALASPVVSFASFALLVLAPWIFIVVAYLRALREVTLTSEGINVATRLRRVGLRWDEIKHVYLAHTATVGDQRLTMVFEPKDVSREALEIDLARESSPIRARNCFIAEISRLFGEPLYAERSEISLADMKIVSF